MPHKLTLTVVSLPPDRDMTVEEIAALFERVTGQKATAQDLEDIKAELDQPEEPKSTRYRK